MTQANTTTLSQVLASRLDAVVPRPLRVRYRDGIIGVVSETSDDWSGGQGSWRFDDATATREERIGSLARYCEQVLSGIQDQVVLELRTVWPQAASNEARNKLPLPFADVMGDAIRLGFRLRGQAEPPVLELAPIELAEFGFA